ncbi:hypothetical protein AMELA_G00193230 [Ameiurus melas]|uniref:Cadherin domain-containing protein n=1 Tax=Ameiurus melas TaxID=219545 RepID=A0A7J6A4V8_AMEME|nr:hypothetical protein AMELA_G00193230 [Ameiurus melas]
MRTITAITIILFIMTVGAQEIGSSVSKIRQKRNWVVEIFTMKRGFTGSLGHLTAIGDIQTCKIYGPGVDENPKGLFLITKEKKEIIVTGDMEYERRNFTFIFECAHLKHVQERLAVDVIVEELHEPYFSKSTYVISAEESMLQGTNLLSMLEPNSIGNKTLTINVKVTPLQHYAVFVVSEKLDISFRGCLDYEEHKNYTVVVEVKDTRHLTPHSSTATVTINIIDKNDQKPVITGKTGSGRIKEREIGAEVYRIQVVDKDSPGSPGWRAKFTLHGEKAENFKIEANPETNEGILSVVKPLDYEETQVLNLTVQVENEEPFFSCSVRKMYYDGQMCDVDYSRNGSSSATLSFPIIVEDVNDPPEFTDTVKHVTVMENTPPGHSLWTFTVTDQDRNPRNKHKFIKGKDIDNWVTIDPMTGNVSTVKVLDRESPFVEHSDNTYTVIFLAVDDGIPLKTGTGTLIIHLLDQNDNAPLLKNNEVTICLPKSMTNITAVDLDLPPFGTPFTYELQDDQGKWKLDPSQGETVNLVKDSSVYSGSYKLNLNITDCGGLSSIQTLSVTVRTCTGDGRYLIRTGATILFIIFICLLLMLCVLLMVFKCSWCSYEAEKITFTEIGDSKAIMTRQKKFARPPHNDLDATAKQKQLIIIQNRKIYEKQQQMKLIRFQNSWEITEKQALNNKYALSDEWLVEIWTTLNIMIEKKLSSLHDQGKELCDYKPHPYNNEGEPGGPAELDSISLADSQFNLGELENLDFKFHKLATLCRPDLIQQSYTSQASFSSHHYQYHHHHHSHQLL